MADNVGNAGFNIVQSSLRCKVALPHINRGTTSVRSWWSLVVLSGALERRSDVIEHDSRHISVMRRVMAKFPFPPKLAHMLPIDAMGSMQCVPIHAPVVVGTPRRHSCFADRHFPISARHSDIVKHTLNLGRGFPHRQQTVNKGKVVPPLRDVVVWARRKLRDRKSWETTPPPQPAGLPKAPSSPLVSSRTILQRASESPPACTCVDRYDGLAHSFVQGLPHLIILD